MVKRSRARRTGEWAWGLVLMAKAVLLSVLVVVILAAGVWTSWGTAQHVMLSKGRERGAMVVGVCGPETCTGAYTASGFGDSYPEVTVDESVGRRAGVRIPVALKPGTKDAVLIGPAGVLHAWAPLGGALLLAALVMAGGLRMPRTAWTAGLSGVVLLGAAFVLL